MNQGSGSIGLLLNSMVILLCVGLMNHVLVIPTLFDKAGRDAWISVLFAGALLLIWLGLLYFIQKNINHMHLKDWLKETFSPWVAWAITVPFLVYLVLMTYVTLRETITWLNTSILPNTPIIVTATALILLCMFAAYFGIQGIAIMSGVLLPLVVILGYFVSFANMKFKDFRLLMPFFEYGIMPSINGMVIAGSGMIELVILILLRRHLKASYKVWHLWILGLIIVYLLVGPITAAIAEFGPFLASAQRYPAFEEWRLVKIGQHLEHVDFLVIYQWTSGAFIRMATFLFVFVDILHLQKQWHNTIALLVVTGLVLIASQFPLTDSAFLLFLENFYFPMTLYGVLLISIVLFMLVLFSRKKRKMTNAQKKI